MDSDYKVRLATLGAMGGDTAKNYASVYDIDLAILEIVEQGGGGGGDVTKQYVDTQDEAVKEWVSASSYITAAALPDMNSYVSKNELSAQSYTTATYVSTYYAKVATLTQAEYDALVTKDPMTLYIISDAV